MGAFQKPTKATAIAPRRVVTVPPSAFAETWRKRPQAPVKIGIRSLGDEKAAAATKMAIESAILEYPAGKPNEFRVDTYNDYVVSNALAQACVHPHDVTLHYFAPGPEDLIRESLTLGGRRFLWDQYVRFELEDSPVVPEATDEQTQALALRLADGFDAVEPAVATRLRRHAAAMLELLGAP